MYNSRKQYSSLQGSEFEQKTHPKIKAQKDAEHDPCFQTPTYDHMHFQKYFLLLITCGAYTNYEPKKKANQQLIDSKIQIVNIEFIIPKHPKMFAIATVKPENWSSLDQIIYNQNRANKNYKIFKIANHY
eukprot:TRINITY_DN818_c0_g1_i1.p6 TRINITY_DN818_c0_g1~~TRINITY_DN818_c0_g1_i1.p6  ORF type:complete len:130 (-),score=2.54 TRINITY_DN818_c0_g1_i1:760-1149(-)